jgi:predicted nucleic acid-binding protein
MDFAGHPGHQAVKTYKEKGLNSPDTFAIAPQVLQEYIHIITDPKLFESRLSIQKALQRARQWWNSISPAG